MNEGLRRWIRSPKGMLTMLLFVLFVLGTVREGVVRTTPQVALAVLVCAVVDIASSALRRGRISPPDSALITGLMIGLILIPEAPPGAVVTAAGLASASKHWLRAPQFHLLNPAAAGLLGSLLLVPVGQSWWGALADLSPILIAVLLLGGAIIAWRINKRAAVLAFFGLYFTAFTLAALLLPPSGALAAVFRPPFLNACLFFGLLMVTDPATSPNRQTDQLWFGAITALVSAAAFIVTHGLHYLFIGLIVANAWFAWRRTIVAREAQPRIAATAP